MRDFIKLILFSFSILFFSGCEKKKLEEKYLAKNEVIIESVNNLNISSVEEISLLGFQLLPNAKLIRSFIKDDIFVCDYQIDKNKKDSFEDFKKLLLILEDFYINDGWAINEKIFTENYLSFYGEKPNKYLNVILILNNNQINIHSSIINE